MAKKPQKSSAGSMEEAVGQVIDLTVKILMSDGGSGTGLYLPGDRVLTCAHVVSGDPGIGVLFRNEEQIAADVVAIDPTVDLALLALRTPSTALDPYELDDVTLDPESLDPGEALVAIGHPLNLDWAVTGGHFNGLRRPGDDALRRFGITLDCSLVQIDVAINPGNSGGPVIDDEGRLVGIATSVINPALANNIGFAVALPAVQKFWQTHQVDDQPLAAYDCGHHHGPDLEFCPGTGKPTSPLGAAPVAPPDSLYYSCGHFHAPGLKYCPDTGKPIESIEGQPRAVTPDDGEPAVEATCSNCGKTFADMLEHCPHCGKPR